MDKKLKINKALLLLDKEHYQEAISLLQDAYNEAQEANDPVYVIKAAVILGDCYFQMESDELASKWLNSAIAASEADDDLLDIVGYEIETAKKILSEITQANG